MKSSFIRAARRVALSGVAITVLAPASAWAQVQPGPGNAADQTKVEDRAQKRDNEIVVTGTLLRGKAPVGSNLISVGQAKLEESAAISSNELLATIPQVTNYFNNVPTADLAIATNQIQISRPNLRNISSNNAASSATLILVDGHRIASAGITQASVDPDAIPTGAIERVEVVTEGGSATYGSDAVAGVINFVTRKRFDGLKVDAHYGIADQYWQWDGSITAGKDWGSGSFWISDTYTKNRALFGGDRSFIHNLNYAAQPYVGLSHQCNAPNINIANNLPAAFGGGLESETTYAYSPGAQLTANTANTCEASTNQAIVPAVERNGVMAGLTQDLDQNTTFTARAFYSSRKSVAERPLTGSVTMSTNNPFAVTPAGAKLGPGAICSPSLPIPFCNGNETVDFSFAPLLGNASAPQTTLIREWGINGELTHKFGRDWEVRGLVNYSGSDSKFDLVEANPTLLNAAGAGTTTSTAFDPFNLAMTNSSVLAGIVKNEIAGEAKDALVDLRLVADGSLFALPGGNVRLAVGGEYMRDEYAQRYETDIPIGSLGTYPFNNYGRNIKSLFGELNLPVFGQGNGPSLVLSASGRYDDYSDFGHTTNPKLGATFKPVNWLSLRGNWGTSFNAPTPLDQLGSLRNTISAFPFVAFTPPGATTPPGAYTLGLQGSAPNLKPQTADTWSIGFDATPPALPGLRTSLSFYRVVFKNIIETPEVNSAIIANYPNNFLFPAAGQSSLTNAQLLALEPLAPNGAATIGPLIGNKNVYEFVNFLVNNYGAERISGLDFSANYQHPTGFGSFDLAFNGNYQLSRKAQISATSPVTDQLATDTPRMLFSANAGVDIGTFRAQATVNHNSGYAIMPTASVPVQTQVGSFTTVDLFFKYDVKSASKILSDLSLTLNVKNVFDANPPVYLATGPGDYGYTNGFTLGRMFVIGASKKF